MIRTTSFALAAMLTTAAASAEQANQAYPSNSPDIVVTGTSLKDAQATLARCLERHCPPDADIAATLAVAETQFVAGDYHAARTTMLKSIARNRGFAKTYPVPVSDLMRANSRVALHLGESEAYFNSALNVISALKAGLPNTDWRVLGARLELGDAYAKTGRIEAAVELYQMVAHRAHDLHLGRVEGFALLRTAALYAAASNAQHDIYYKAAIQACNALAAKTDPDLAAFAGAAMIVRAKLSVKQGEAGAVDRLIETYRRLAPTSATPVLLYAPKIRPPELSGRETNSGENVNKLALGNFDNQWVDIGFQIGSDGKVSEAEVLRKSDKLSSDWVGPVLTAISERRYAPTAANTPESFRVERYTYTSYWTTLTGSRLRVRSPIPQIELVDLSRDPRPAAP